MAAACTLLAHLPALQALLLLTMGLWGQPTILHWGPCMEGFLHSSVSAWEGPCVGVPSWEYPCMVAALHEGVLAWCYFCLGAPAWWYPCLGRLLFGDIPAWWHPWMGGSLLGGVSTCWRVR